MCSVASLIFSTAGAPVERELPPLQEAPTGHMALRRTGLEEHALHLREIGEVHDSVAGEIRIRVRLEEDALEPRRGGRRAVQNDNARTKAGACRIESAVFSQLRWGGGDERSTFIASSCREEIYVVAASRSRPSLCQTRKLLRARESRVRRSSSN